MIAYIAEEKVHLAETLQTHRPQLDQENTKVEITVHNNIQQKRISEEQDLLLKFLREKLQNDEITLSVNVDETKVEKKFFTTSEKLQNMVNKNPDLNLLRKMFDLDLE